MKFSFLSINRAKLIITLKKKTFLDKFLEALCSQKSLKKSRLESYETELLN